MFYFYRTSMDTTVHRNRKRPQDESRVLTMNRLRYKDQDNALLCRFIDDSQEWLENMVRTMSTPFCLQT
jgi:hypothetical protein